MTDALTYLESNDRLERVPSELPVLPMRDMVVFPYVIQPLVVGREKSRKALDAALAGSRHILLLPQREAGTDDPENDDLYEFGTVAECLQVLRLPDDTVRVTVEGLARARVTGFTEIGGYLSASVELLDEPAADGSDIEALNRVVLTLFENCVHLGNRIPIEALEHVRQIDEPGRLADLVTSYLGLELSQRQAILETLPAAERLELLAGFLTREVEILEIERRIHTKVKKELEGSQREYYLRERIKAIQEELGERDERAAELDELRAKIDDAGMPDAVREKALKEVDRLSRMPSASPA